MSITSTQSEDISVYPCLDLWCCVDAQQVVIAISADLQALLDMPSVVGQPLSVVLSPKPPVSLDLLSWLAASQTILQQQPSVSLPPQAYQVGDKTYYWVIQVIPIAIAEMTAVKCCLFDGSAWWHCQQQLAQTHAELTRIHNVFDKFIYTISHDLRAPLRAIDGFTRLLAEQATEDQNHEQGRMLQVIGNSSNQMSALLEDVLLLARLQRMTAHPKPTAMKPLISEVWQALNPPTRIEFIMDELPSVLVDGDLWRIAWRELLANAIKFTVKQAQPHIVLSAEVTDHEVIYHLRDNGAGFDMRYADKLFQMSQRLHSASQFAGTGMGLAMVARIVVEMHGGRVWVDSSVGGGTCFHVALAK